MDDRQDLDLDGIKQGLEQERDTLLKENEASADERRPVELDQQSVGRLSRMDALQVQAMAKAIKVRRQVRLQWIKSALQRIDEGEFGYCARCRDEIPVKRLEIDAATEFCVNCAS